MEIESKKKKSAGSSSSMLAPGFRFHPTDEELVRYYLRRKVCGKGFRFDAISDIDIYRTEPWDLPSFSKLKSRDKEWYFFSMLDKKYGNGSRTNRATEKGYWKTTGKDRAVYHRSQIVGMKKTLVYHLGRAPKGQRSNWVMHEYRLEDLELEKSGISQDAFVLCRVFQKSGTGPKNGEQYGAPFEEEEWEEEELDVIPKEEAAEEVDFGDAYLDGYDLEQILGPDVPSDAAPIPVPNLPHSEAPKAEVAAESVEDPQNFLVSDEEKPFESVQNGHIELYDLPLPYEVEVKAVKHEYMGESSNSGNSDNSHLDYLLDDPFPDSSDNLKYSDGGFIEANDLSHAGETEPSAFDMLDEYFTYFDANTDNSDFIMYDPEGILENADLVSDEALLTEKKPNDGTDQATLPNAQFTNDGDSDATLPSGEKGLAGYKSGYEHPFFKQASKMLGGIHAPPAFAAEFPSKDAILRLNAAQSSTHVTAGMIHIRNLDMDGQGRDVTAGKHENFNIILSFGFARRDDGSARMESSISIFPGKNGWLYLMCLFILILSMSFKIGTYICAH